MQEERFYSGLNFTLFVTLFSFITMIASFSAYGQAIVQWDFSKGTHGWVGNNRVEKLACSPEGLLVTATGQDPWIEGPAINLPGDKITTVKIRMKSTADASAQLFYGKVFTEKQSVRFRVQNDGKWHDYFLVIRDKLGPGTRFRLDPCAGQGEITVANISVEAIGEIVAPSLIKPERPDTTSGLRASVQSAGLKLEHYGKKWGNFALMVNGSEMAAGYPSGLIGLLFDDRTEWINLKDAKFIIKTEPKGEFTSRVVTKDSKGGRWEIQKHIKPGEVQGTLVIETEFRVNKDRDVIYIPWLTMFPGLGTFGESKYQGLFAGIEYLCDEPSSSDADIARPNHIRRVPDPAKITFPLMAITHNGNYIGVIWEPSDMVSATFDSPDRIYHSGAHVMALSAPAVGQLRFENDLFARATFELKANKPIHVSILIIGGKGKAVVPAVKHYVALKGLPALPEFEGGFDAAVNLLAYGWLDSQINQDGLFRHAVWDSSFGARPAADAAMYVDWLANHTQDDKLRERLNAATKQALSRISAGQAFSSSISHAQLPTAPLVFGRTYEFARQRHREALNLLRNFDENGIKLYRPGKIDYSKTHFAKHTNGLSGRDMVRILEGATLSADKELINKALKLLDKQTALYADTVPRGAQTWEIPLHTPDILASAHLVKAYTLGYIISGKEEYIRHARYWAWTGVPFIYLYAPTPGRVGPYATIPVLGATNWKAPIWVGKPVQWCGLVYCSALHLLSEYDKNGPWGKIARGITTAGLQMSWPLSDKNRQGLLPDLFDLRHQAGAGPAINPGTVQAHLAELYGKGKIYDVKKLRQRGWFIHAPCVISNIRESRDAVTLKVDGWADKPYYVLISGVREEPTEVRVRRIFQPPTELPLYKPARKEFHSEHQSLVISLEGKSEIQIRY